MVFCGLYPIDGDQFSDLRDALEKLRLNDGSYTYEPETSGALGFGFRCGFLGLLHMEIIRERLVREFNLDLIATAPSVAYLVHRTDGSLVEVSNPSALPADDGDRLHRGADAHLHDPHAEGLHGHDHGALPAAAGRDEQARVPLARAHGARSTGCPLAEVVARLLRPAQEPHAGLRLPRLRAVGLRPLGPREGRRAAQRRAGRRLLEHPPQGQGAGLRPAHVREAQASSSRGRCSTCRSRPPSAGGSSAARR